MTAGGARAWVGPHAPQRLGWGAQPPKAWSFSTATGSSQQLHERARPEPMSRSAVVCRPIGRAVVLGSTQPAPPLDRLPPGTALARRVSGGGAVWIAPGEIVWVDVDLPVDDPLWDDDVGRSFLWLGRVWAQALKKVDVGGATVWDGGLKCGPAGRALCFAALGPGEVSVAGRKVIGISQRRTREGTRFHCAALLRWSPIPLARVMGVPESVWPELAELAGGLDVAPDGLVTAFHDVMSDSRGPAAG